MKEKKEKIFQDKKGITLIALVVTIIILIILAGVLINLTISNDGLFKKAKTAKAEYERNSAIELMNLKIANVQASKYSEEQKMPTLKELADAFSKDNDFEYVGETSIITGLTEIENENPSSIFTKLKKYPYEFEINSSLKIANINGINIQESNNPTNNGNSTNDDSTIEKISVNPENFSDPFDTLYGNTEIPIVNSLTDKVVKSLGEYIFSSDYKITPLLSASKKEDSDYGTIYAEGLSYHGSTSSSNLYKAYDGYKSTSWASGELVSNATTQNIGFNFNYNVCVLGAKIYYGTGDGGVGGINNVSIQVGTLENNTISWTPVSFSIYEDSNNVITIYADEYINSNYVRIQYSNKSQWSCMSEIELYGLNLNASDVETKKQNIIDEYNYNIEDYLPTNLEDLYANSYIFENVIESDANIQYILNNTGNNGILNNMKDNLNAINICKNSSKFKNALKNNQDAYESIITSRLLTACSIIPNLTSNTSEVQNTGEIYYDVSFSHSSFSSNYMYKLFDGETMTVWTDSDHNFITQSNSGYLGFKFNNNTEINKVIIFPCVRTSSNVYSPTSYIVETGVENNNGEIEWTAVTESVSTTNTSNAEVKVISLQNVNTKNIRIRFNSGSEWISISEICFL